MPHKTPPQVSEHFVLVQCKKNKIKRTNNIPLRYHKKCDIHNKYNDLTPKTDITG